MNHLTPDQIRHQDAIAREIADAVTRYLAEEEARLPAWLICHAIEDAKADLGLSAKETAA